MVEIIRFAKPSDPSRKDGWRLAWRRSAFRP